MSPPILPSCTALRRCVSCCSGGLEDNRARHDMTSCVVPPDTEKERQVGGITGGKRVRRRRRRRHSANAVPVRAQHLLLLGDEKSSSANGQAVGRQGGIGTGTGTSDKPEQLASRGGSCAGSGRGGRMDENIRNVEVSFEEQSRRCQQRSTALTAWNLASMKLYIVYIPRDSTGILRR